MIPIIESNDASGIRIPRESGDDPFKELNIVKAAWYSPRERG